MYEELYEPLPQKEPYLKRLGLAAVPAADLLKHLLPV